MIKLALVGRDISHSLSPEIYRSFLGKNLEYSLLDYETADKIPPLIELMSEYHGLSVTAPYKTHFLPSVQASEKVIELGALNCIYRDSDNNLCAENTDYLAMAYLVKRDV